MQLLRVEMRMYFVSSYFGGFVKLNGCRSLWSSPAHPFWAVVEKLCRKRTAFLGISKMCGSLKFFGQDLAKWRTEYCGKTQEMKCPARQRGWGISHFWSGGQLRTEGACSLLAFPVHPHEQRREEFPALPAGCLLYAHHLCGEFAQKLRWTVKLSFLAFTCFASLTVRILAKLKYFLLPVSIQAFCYL